MSFCLYYVITDEHGVVFFERAVDKPGVMQDAESYTDSLRKSMQRPNATGLSTDDATVMGKCMQNIMKEFPGVVTTPCHWHKADNAAPINVGLVKESLADTGTVISYFKNRGVPSGTLRNLRETYNQKERSAASNDKRKTKMIPTLKV